MSSYLTGKTGSVLVNGVSESFGKWKLPMKADMVKITNWNTVPFHAFVAACLGAKLTLEMPCYDQGNVGLTVGNAYTFACNWTSVLGLSVTALIEELTPSNDAEGVPKLDVSAQVTGVFPTTIA